MHSLCRTTEKKHTVADSFSTQRKRKEFCMSPSRVWERARRAHRQQTLFQWKTQKKTRTNFGIFHPAGTMVSTVQHIHWWRWINAPNTPFRGQPNIATENIVGKHEATHHPHIAHCSETVWKKSVTGSASRYRCNLANKCADIFPFGETQREKKGVKKIVYWINGWSGKKIKKNMNIWKGILHATFNTFQLPADWTKQLFNLWKLTNNSDTRTQ